MQYRNKYLVYNTKAKKAIEKKQAKHAGCNAIIVKIFSKSELYEIIEKQFKKTPNNN